MTKYFKIFLVLFFVVATISGSLDVDASVNGVMPHPSAGTVDLPLDMVPPPHPDTVQKAAYTDAVTGASVDVLRVIKSPELVSSSLFLFNVDGTEYQPSDVDKSTGEPGLWSYTTNSGGQVPAVLVYVSVTGGQSGVNPLSLQSMAEKANSDGYYVSFLGAYALFPDQLDGNSRIDHACVPYTIYNQMEHGGPPTPWYDGSYELPAGQTREGWVICPLHSEGEAVPASQVTITAWSPGGALSPVWWRVDPKGFGEGFWIDGSFSAFGGVEYTGRYQLTVDGAVYYDEEINGGEYHTKIHAAYHVTTKDGATYTSLDRRLEVWVKSNNFSGRTGIAMGYYQGDPSSDIQDAGTFDRGAPAYVYFTIGPDVTGVDWAATPVWQVHPSAAHNGRRDEEHCYFSECATLRPHGEESVYAVVNAGEFASGLVYHSPTEIREPERGLMIYNENMELTGEVNPNVVLTYVLIPYETYGAGIGGRGICFPEVEEYHPVIINCSIFERDESGVPVSCRQVLDGRGEFLPLPGGESYEMALLSDVGDAVHYQDPNRLSKSLAEWAASGNVFYLVDEYRQIAWRLEK